MDDVPRDRKSELEEQRQIIRARMLNAKPASNKNDDEEMERERDPAQECRQHQALRFELEAREAAANADRASEEQAKELEKKNKDQQQEQQQRFVDDDISLTHDAALEEARQQIRARMRATQINRTCNRDRDYER